MRAAFSPWSSTSSKCPSYPITPTSSMPGGGENFGLAELCAGQANGPGFDQAAADVGRFVALGMWTPPHAALSAEVCSLGHVRLESIEIDEQRRRVKLLLGRAKCNKHK